LEDIVAVSDRAALRAPRGLSREAREQWHARIDEFRELGTLRASLVDLVSGWARAWDAQRAAEAAWEAAGRPETQVGSTGQERRHHLAQAKDRADRHLDSLTAKLERASYRRKPQRRGVPDGAVVVGGAAGGGPVFIHDGKLWHRAANGDEWVHSVDEWRVDQGCALRWLGADGRSISYCDPPPCHVGRRMPSKWDALRWARRNGVPAAAVLEWFERPDARTTTEVRDDIDIAECGVRRAKTWGGEPAPAGS
jgi:hypothetical protein